MKNYEDHQMFSLSALLIDRSLLMLQRFGHHRILSFCLMQFILLLPETKIVLLLLPTINGYGRLILFR